MDLENISAVPVIVFVCYLLVEVVKVIFGKYEKVKELLPLISAFAGAVISTILFSVFPEILPVKSYVSAIIIGLFSGLSATGSNQIWKQLNKIIKQKNEPKKDEWIFGIFKETKWKK